jgi:hypothetical protein
MMIRSKLAEVGARLEEAVAKLPGEPTDAQDLFNRYEEMAIQILDGRCEEFDPIELSEYLESILHTRRMELGLYRDPDIE